MRDVNSVVFGQAGPARQADAGLWGATRIKFGPGPPLTLTRPSGALGQAGGGGDQDRPEHKAHDADRGKDKTLPSGQAFAFGIVEERGDSSCRGRSRRWIMRQASILSVSVPVRPERKRGALPTFSPEARLQIADRFLDCGLGGVWKRRVYFGQLEQFVDAADSLGDNNAELRWPHLRSSSAV
jgi:hypothetical protein